MPKLNPTSAHTVHLVPSLRCETSQIECCESIRWAEDPSVSAPANTLPRIWPPLSNLGGSNLGGSGLGTADVGGGHVAERAICRDTKTIDERAGKTVVLAFVWFCLLALLATNVRAQQVSGERKSDEGSREFLGAQIDRAQVDSAISLGNIDALGRIAKADRLEMLYDSMIKTEQARLSLRRSMAERRAAAKAVHTVDSQSEIDCTRMAASSNVQISAPSSSRRIQTTSYRDSDAGQLESGGVVTLLRRKKLSLPSPPPVASPPGNESNFQPLIVSRPPTTQLQSKDVKPNTTIDVASEAVVVPVAEPAKQRGPAKAIAPQSKRKPKVASVAAAESKFASPVASPRTLKQPNPKPRPALQSVLVDDSLSRSPTTVEAPSPSADVATKVTEKRRSHQRVSAKKQLLPKLPPPVLTQNNLAGLVASKGPSGELDQERDTQPNRQSASQSVPKPASPTPNTLSVGPKKVTVAAPRTAVAQTSPAQSESASPPFRAMVASAPPTELADEKAPEVRQDAVKPIESGQREYPSNGVRARLASDRQSSLTWARPTDRADEIASNPVSSSDLGLTQPETVSEPTPPRDVAAREQLALHPPAPQQPASDQRTPQQAMQQATPPQSSDRSNHASSQVADSEAASRQMPTAADAPDASVAAQWPFALGGQSDILPTPNSKDVTLSVNDADVRTVLEVLAKGYGMNILVAPDVAGSVTANVSGLTPEQTLNSVVRMCGLAIEREDNVILVYPKDNLPREARRLRVFPLDFARSEVVEPTVTGLLSPIGNAYSSHVDELDNRKGRESIVVVDTPEVIAQVEQYILQADQPPRQVMIEARVLEVELKDDMEHGVNFEAIFGADFRVGGFNLTNNIATSTNPFYFGEISGSDLKALITALETTTDAKTLATPSVMVVNGQHAKIQVGQQLGFAVATVTQTSTIQDVRYLDTGVVLEVTPTISRDNRVLLQVKPKVSSGEINPDTLLPEETTREVETSVMLDNHQGMIVGGLIQEADRVTIKKLPWVGDFKHVGKFFQRRESTRSRSEIIVALIPHIIESCESGHCSIQDPFEKQIQWERTEDRLFNGPLNRECRPSESRLPDVTNETWIHRDIDRQRNRNPNLKGCEPIHHGLLLSH